MTPASRPTTARPRRAAPGAPHATGAFSMSSYRLRSHIRHCQFGPRTICLDLAASRYFLLEGAAAAHLTDFVEGAACGATIGHPLHPAIIEPGAREHAPPKAAFPTATARACQQPAPSTWSRYRQIGSTSRREREGQ